MCQGLVPSLETSPDLIRVGVEINSNDPSVPRQLRHVIDIRVGGKEAMIKLDRNEGRLSVIQMPNQAVCTLDEDLIMELCEIALRISRQFAFPQRIMWGVRKRDEIFVFGSESIDCDQFLSILELPSQSEMVTCSEVEYNERRFIAEHDVDVSTPNGNR